MIIDQGAVADALAPDYKLGGAIARTLQSLVYSATELATGRERAIKVMAVGDTVDLRNFLAEIARVTSIRHEHVLPVLDAFEAEELCFMVMERMPLDLSKVIDQKLPLSVVCALIRQAAQGLQAAHAQNIMHLDIKPSNMLLDASGNLKLADFGNSMILLGTSITANGKMTPRYAAPEQWDGEHVSAATDIYALGFVFYELLAQRPAFGRITQSQLRTYHRKVTPNPLPGVPKPLQDLVSDMMRKDRYQRIQSCRELLERLDHLGDQLLSRDWRQSRVDPDMILAVSGHPPTLRVDVPGKPATAFLTTIHPPTRRVAPSDPPKPSPALVPTLTQVPGHRRGPSSSRHSTAKPVADTRHTQQAWIDRKGLIVLAAVGLVLIAVVLWISTKALTPGGPALQPGAKPGAPTYLTVDAVRIDRSQFRLTCKPGDNTDEPPDCRSPLHQGELEAIVVYLQGINLDDLHKLCHDGYLLWLTDNQPAQVDQLNEPSSDSPARYNRLYMPNGRYTGPPKGTRVPGSDGDLCWSYGLGGWGHGPIDVFSLDQRSTVPGPLTITIQLLSRSGHELLAASMHNQLNSSPA